MAILYVLPRPDNKIHNENPATPVAKVTTPEGD